MSQLDDPPLKPADLVPRLAVVLHADFFPSGERAALKRLGLQGPPPLSYHRFLLRHVPEIWQAPKYDGAWRALISGLAMQHGYPHEPTRPLGRALAETGYSEKRLERLLAAQDRVLSTLALRAMRKLAAARARCDWRDFARLLFARGDDFRERINRRVASDYYRTSTKTESTAAT